MNEYKNNDCILLFSPFFFFACVLLNFPIRWLTLEEKETVHALMEKNMNELKSQTIVIAKISIMSGNSFFSLSQFLSYSYSHTFFPCLFIFLYTHFLHFLSFFFPFKFL